MFRVSNLVVLLTLVACWTASGQEKPVGDKTFDGISHKHIKELVEKAKKDERIRPAPRPRPATDAHWRLSSLLRIDQFHFRCSAVSALARNRT